MTQLGRHFIFTSGRSGSNYLSNTLNLSPECVNFGEVLGYRTLPYRLFGKFICRAYGADAYLDFIYRSTVFFYLAQLYSAYSHVRTRRKISFKIKRKTRSIGVKDFLVTMELHEAFDFLRNNRDIKIIYLHRKNLLKRYVSAQYLTKSKIPVAYSKVKTGSIYLDPNTLIAELDVYSAEADRESQFLTSLHNREILNVTYEAYFRDSTSVVNWNNKIAEFLDIKPINAMSKQKKILADSFSDVVSNSSEVIEALSGTRYEKYLY